MRRAPALRQRGPGCNPADCPATHINGTRASQRHSGIADSPITGTPHNQTHPLLAASDELRTTLPGEFDKLPATIVDGQVTLETGGALSRHILKPAKPGLRESVLNEGFVMSLAEGLGIPVAETVVLQGQVAILGSTRVEHLSETRSESPATTDVTVRAQAMEDFCQLLGFSPEQKYEREGGPRYADIAAWLREYSYAPALCLRNLVRWACFGFLCGFGAGHNKQLAVLYDKNGIRLAPFFGIWSTQVYPQMSARMGFAIGGEDRPDWLTPTRWRDFATTIGVRPAYVLGELERMADELPRLAAQTADDYQKQNGYASVLRRIRVLIEQRARQVAVSLAAEKGVRLQRKTA